MVVSEYGPALVGRGNGAVRRATDGLLHRNFLTAFTVGKILLAPMEGVLDSLLRDLLTRIGGYDGAVTEFVRVSNSLLPLRSFWRVCPELANGSRTSAGTPVAVQLLGTCPEFLAKAAVRLSRLRPAGIDLNFGCPAPTVNRHGGGAMLLDDPDRMWRIAEAVRRAVPGTIPVTAKMRLGIRDTEKTLDCARALESAGMNALVVHARTKVQVYRPPVHWEWIARVRESVSLPIVANGEIVTLADYLRCREVTGCEDVMIGRGAVVNPFLARHIRSGLGGAIAETDHDSPEESAFRMVEWLELLPLLGEFWQRVQQKVTPQHAPGRLKLWLNSLRCRYRPAELLYLQLRTVNDVRQANVLLARQGIAAK